MTTGNNHHLAEVLCSFFFNPALNPWDSTFFGKYFEHIEKIGYTEKLEQQGYQLKFDLNNIAVEKSSAQADKLEPRMLFKSPQKSAAIIMASNYISFHKLPPYVGWESFLEEYIKPGLKYYSEIGLGKGLMQVQMLYLNKYIFDRESNLSDIFNFLPAVEKFGIGKERGLTFQSQYELEPNLLVQINLNSIITPDNNKQVFLECSCLALNNLSETNWIDIASQAHDTNNKVFKTITNK